jgi:hypothetical protein
LDFLRQKQARKSQVIGNKVGAVNDSQDINAPKGAHGKRSVRQRSKSVGIQTSEKLKNTGISSTTSSSKQRRVSICMGQIATARILLTMSTFDKLLKQNLSSEAKTVYTTALGILKEVSKCKSFEAEKIHEAISKGLENAKTIEKITRIGLENVKTIEDPKCTVGFFDENKDGESYKAKNQKKSIHGTDALIGLTTWMDGSEKPNAIEKGQNQGIKLCKQLKLNKKKTQPQNNELPNPQNPKNITIDLKNFTDDNDTISYGFKNKENKTIEKPKISCPKDFNIEKYLNQINREISQFSGNVTIHRLEPGTVLVRVFGKGQSILSSCWCDAADSASTVKEAKDLYNKLAVRPDWNGDGNLGIWIIPEGIDVYVAEGKIASQVGPYSEFEMRPTTKIIDGVAQTEKHQTDFFYIFEGGCTQLNVFSSNLFADVKDQKIFNQTMFVFRDSNMINPNPSPSLKK